MGTRRVFAGTGGIELVATQRGEGRRSVLFLHGGGQTRHAWDKPAREVAASGWRTVSLDQRGHGDSAWDEAGRYTFRDYADDAAAIGAAIAAEDGIAPVAVGASLGGIAALHTFAPQRRPVFGGIVLVDIIPRMDPRGVAHVQGFMAARAREGFASVEEAADAVAAYLPHRPRPRSLEGLRKNLRLHGDGRWRWHWDPRFLDGPANVNTDWSAIEAELEAAARVLAVPLLLVRGGASELVSPEAAKEFLSLVPHGRYVDIAEARHMVAGDRNDVFGDTILRFLTEAFDEITL